MASTISRMKLAMESSPVKAVWLPNQFKVHSDTLAPKERRSKVKKFIKSHLNSFLATSINKLKTVAFHSSQNIEFYLIWWKDIAICAIVWKFVARASEIAITSFSQQKSISNIGSQTIWRRNLSNSSSWRISIIKLYDFLSCYSNIRCWRKWLPTNRRYIIAFFPLIYE